MHHTFRGKSRFKRFLTARNRIYQILLAVVLVSAYPLVADFYTKGEPREALVAQAMMEDGTFILPRVYADEVAYKPPMFHWMETAFSAFTGGEVTPLSARLPSTAAIFVLAAGLFLFLSQRRPISLSLLASFIFLSALDPHRFGIIARVDMLLTAFICLALLALYKWDEHNDRTGLPWPAILLMSGGFLTKGPVGVVLPLLIFFVFGCIRRYPLGAFVLKLVAIGLLSSLLPLIWYFLAWQQAGDTFLNMVWSENFHRFLGIDDKDLFYNLGHEGKFFKPSIYFILGFIPWTLFVFFVRFRREASEESPKDSLRLFATVVAVTTLVFYMIPMSKSSSYLLPMYPFVSFLVAEGIYSFVRKEDSRMIYFSGLIGLLGAILLAAMVSLQIFGGAETKLFGADLSIFAEGLRRRMGLSLFGELLLILGILTILYQMIRRNFHKLAFATVFMVFIIHFNIDVPALSFYKEQNSARPFAVKTTSLTRDSELYVISDLRDGYYNLYGYAFYSKNRPLSFETADSPREGYLLIWEKDYDRVLSEKLAGYRVEKVLSDIRAIKEGGKMLLLKFQRDDRLK